MALNSNLMDSQAVSSWKPSGGSILKASDLCDGISSGGVSKSMNVLTKAQKKGMNQKAAKEDNARLKATVEASRRQAGIHRDWLKDTSAELRSSMVDHESSDDEAMPRLSSDDGHDWIREPDGPADQSLYWRIAILDNFDDDLDLVWSPEYIHKLRQLETTAILSRSLFVLDSSRPHEENVEGVLEECEDLSRLNRYSKSGISIAGACFQGSNKGCASLAEALMNHTATVTEYSKTKADCLTLALETLLMNIRSSKKFMPWKCSLTNAFDDMMTKLDEILTMQLTLCSEEVVPVLGQSEMQWWSGWE